MHPSMFPVSLMVHHISDATCMFCLICALSLCSSRLVLSNIFLDATKPCRPIYVAAHGPIRVPSRQSRLPDETLGEMEGGRGEEGRMEGKHMQQLAGEEHGGGKQAPKNNEAKSEDKRGAISVAGFMYCQHYPRY